jgi:hypothetical protein
MVASSYSGKPTGAAGAIGNQDVIDLFELGAEQTVKAILDADLAALVALSHAGAPEPART